MKWDKKKKTANKGVLKLEEVVNDHGSIFRPVHEEDDVGIDGFIELVESEEATGKLIAVQVKSGESYVASNGKHFRVPVDDDHLAYWASYLVPVILVCYSPERDVLCWEVVNEYIRREKYHERGETKSIKIDFDDIFDIRSMSEGLTRVANSGKDRAILIECIDNCLIGEEREKISALSVLRSHPDSRDSRTTAFLARRLIEDKSDNVVKEAIYVLGFHVGRGRWSWNPNNREELDLIHYAEDLCMDLTYEECRRLIELVDDEPFYGEDALGERVLDIISVVPDVVLYLREIAADSSLLMQTRINALYVLYNCDEQELLEDTELENTPEVSDVYIKIKSIVDSWG